MTFVDDIILPHTPVKQQAATASCWAFSLCSYWETELAVAQNNLIPSFSFSPWFIARHRIESFCLSHIHDSLPHIHSLPTGDMGQSAVRYSTEFGMVSWDDYKVGPVGQYDNYRKMIRRIKMLLLMGQITRFTRSWCLKEISSVLDHYWGKLPDDSKIIDQTMPQICFYTSFQHLPYHSDVILPLPDNYESYTFRNLPLDEMIQKMKDTLLSGHSFIWQGCVVGGFSPRMGVASLAATEVYDEASRSIAFRQGQITDDHMMHIIGMAHDEAGNTYFIAKNSVGIVGPYNGLIYMEERYIRLKTIAIAL